MRLLYLVLRLKKKQDLNHTGHHETQTIEIKKTKNTLQLKIIKITQNKKGKTIQLLLSKIQDNKPVTFDDLKEVHTKKLHLMIVDESLEDYSHVHPKKMVDDGVYEFDWFPNKNGEYKIWADVVPNESNKQEYVMTVLQSNDQHDDLTPIQKKTILSHSLNGYHFELKFNSGEIKVNKPVMATLTVVDSTGKSVTKLEPIMGAYAHFVGFHDDFNSIEHIHPMGEEPVKNSDRGGPNLMFHMEPKSKGFIKLFVQLIIDGKEMYIPFGFNVH